jgi:hypothetical protein
MSMTRAEIDAYNASYFGIPVEWVPLVYKYMAMAGKDWSSGFDDSGVEYYDALLNKSIWSIGFETKTGRIIASLSSDLYCHPDYTCLWLR